MIHENEFTEEEDVVEVVEVGVEVDAVVDVEVDAAVEEEEE